MHKVPFTLKAQRWAQHLTLWPDCQAFWYCEARVTDSVWFFCAFPKGMPSCYPIFPQVSLMCSPLEQQSAGSHGSQSNTETNKKRPSTAHRPGRGPLSLIWVQRIFKGCCAVSKSWDCTSFLRRCLYAANIKRACHERPPRHNSG